MAILMSSCPLILGAMEAASLGMMSGSWHMSRNIWRSVQNMGRHNIQEQAQHQGRTTGHKEQRMLKEVQALQALQAPLFTLFACWAIAKLAPSALKVLSIKPGSTILVLGSQSC